MIHVCALLLALMVGGLAAYPDIIAIGQSTISTAAISYIFLPFEVAPIILIVLATYYFIIFFRRSLLVRKMHKAVIYGCISIILILSGGLYAFKNYIQPYIYYRSIKSVTETITQMSHNDIQQLITGYPLLPDHDGQRIFILNALLERKDLTASELDQTARINDPVLHHKLYSRYGLLGQNTKGLSIARLIAHHPNVSAATLSFLADINEPYLQSSVASNPRTPVKSLEILYEKSKQEADGYLIQGGLSQNKSTPVEILKSLSLSPHQQTREFARRTLKAVP